MLRIFEEVFDRMDGGFSEPAPDPTVGAVTAADAVRTAAGLSARSKSLRQRADKFEALSRLFDLDLASYRSAIEQLSVPCGGVAVCAMQKSGVRPAAEAALAWVDNVSSLGTVTAEHIRLFGGTDPVRQMPYVSPLAFMYDSSDHDESVARVVSFYEVCGFVANSGGGRSCPTHISNELEFVAYALGRAAEGESQCETAAHDFVANHLSTWGVLFSAAVYSRSEHPVTRFAGLALEHLLLCERERALFDMLNEATHI